MDTAKHAGTGTSEPRSSSGSVVIDAGNDTTTACTQTPPRSAARKWIGGKVDRYSQGEGASCGYANPVLRAKVYPEKKLYKIQAHRP